MHLFLTGDIQVGKSTILRRWLDVHSGLSVGGFRTAAGHRRENGVDSVHIIPAMGEHPLIKENCILLRSGNLFARRREAFPDVFDTVGVNLLKASSQCQLILMDEIGTAESTAVTFQRAVLGRLDGDIPVLGVVGKKAGILADAVRAHPKVALITVTVENREEVLAHLLRRM